METATTNQILSLVQHDLGIGFCPEALAKDYLDRGEIIEIPVKEHANPRDICLLTDSTRPIGIAGKKLLEILMDSEGRYIWRKNFIIICGFLGMIIQEKVLVVRSRKLR